MAKRSFRCKQEFQSGCCPAFRYKATISLLHRCWSGQAATFASKHLKAFIERVSRSEMVFDLQAIENFEGDLVLTAAHVVADASGHPVLNWLNMQQQWFIFQNQFALYIFCIFIYLSYFAIPFKVPIIYHWSYCHGHYLFDESECLFSSFLLHIG